MNNSANETLMGFNAIDIRDTNAGDVVVFRSGSLTHSGDLPQRHGSYARVKGFAKSSKGAPQVQVQFKDGAVVSMAATNLVKRTAEVDDAAPQARKLIENIISLCVENGRTFLIIPSIQVALGEMGMYDRLREPKNAAQATGDLNDLPY